MLGLIALRGAAADRAGARPDAMPT